VVSAWYIESSLDSLQSTVNKLAPHFAPNQTTTIPKVGERRKKRERKKRPGSQSGKKNNPKKRKRQEKRTKKKVRQMFIHTARR